MSDFLRFNHDAAATGQVSFDTFGGNTYELCSEVATDTTLDTWVTTCGAELFLQDYKRDFGYYGEDIRVMSKLLSGNLAETSDLIRSTENRASNLWSSV